MAGRGKERPRSCCQHPPWGPPSGPSSPVPPRGSQAPNLPIKPSAKPLALGLLSRAPDPAPHLVPPSLGVRTAPSAKREQVGQGRGLPTTLPRGCPALAGRTGGKGPWTGGTEGGGEVALVSPKLGKTGCGRGRGRGLGGTCFGSVAELGLPGVKSCLSDHPGGFVGKGGREAGRGAG